MDEIKPVIDHDVRTFVIAALGLSIGAWELAFNAGVYGTVFYSQFFTVWVACTTILLALLLIPDERRPVSNRLISALAVPSLWLLFLGIVPADTNVLVFDLLVFVLALLSIAALPIVGFVLLAVSQEDALELPRRMIVALIFITIFVAAVGFVVGQNHRHFVTCYDFRVAGDDVPDNCNDVLFGIEFE